MDSRGNSYSHEHTLLHHYVENGSTEEQCDVCKGEIYGMVYACQVCKFTRHASCAPEGMPSRIAHPSHSMHDLELIGEWSSDFLCEICFYNCRGPLYSCEYCGFEVDLACASSTIDQPTQGDQGLIPAGRVRNRTTHFSHGEPLDLFKYRKTSQQFELDCSWCDKRLSGMSYGCFKHDRDSMLFLHESCISKIPKRFLHPFHPLHYLSVQYGQSVGNVSCNACKRSISDINAEIHYACLDCSFCLHFSCAGLQPTLKHKCHEHYLTYFSRITFIGEEEERFDCRACGRDCNARNNKEGAFYRCVQCDFNIHLRCLPAPPMAKHGYHLHFLILHRGVIEDDSEEYYCDICEEQRHPKHHIYYCKKCKFIAHIKCVLRKMSESKVRKMMRLVKRVRQSNGEFPKLKETGDKNQLLKMQEIHSLLKDLEQEKNEKQKYFEKDKYAERYASGDDDDVDEGDEVDEKEEEESSDGEQENEEKEEKNEANQGEASTSINDTKELSRLPSEPLKNPALEIRHFSHFHPLKIVQVTESSKYGNCNACAEELRDTIYICQLCKDQIRKDYRLHKACTELPYELQHPLHSQHSLILLSKFPHSRSTWFLCDECGDFSDGFVYLCLDCPFKLDVKCAVFADPKIGSQDPKHRKKETKLLHFSHKHELVLGNFVHTSEPCTGCNFPISGPAYCCLDCFCAIHESCFRILPREMHHPFHPLHHLVALPYEYGRMCHACKLDIYDIDITYGCSQCYLYLHFVCANSLKKVLNSNSHKHNLYYFGPDSQMFLPKFRPPWWCSNNFMCGKCRKMCEGPFYRCVERNINFHLKCVPIPQRIKSKCHLHHLTLKDSFIEDDIGEYYCDVCEEERYPKDHIYYCEECHGFFVAHIQCVLSMDFEQVEYFDENEKNDDDNDHEEGNEAGEDPEQVESFLEDVDAESSTSCDDEEDEKNDDEKGSEAEEGEETSPEITAISKLES